MTQENQAHRSESARRSEHIDADKAWPRSSSTELAPVKIDIRGTIEGPFRVP